MQPLASQYSQQLAALKVLVVDDESAMRKVTRSLLHLIGIQDIYEANDGRSGLEAICRWNPDVVILDWSMPSPNGPEFVYRYVPAPRKMSSYKPATDPAHDDVVFV
jgi:two-component system, chemotaxis family, chemotaxis protein CheY